MVALAASLFLGFVCLSSARRGKIAPTSTSPTTCERIEVPMCHDIGYNFTHFPSIRHQSQEEAGFEIHQFFPLVKLECSPYVREFLCSYYVPECTEAQQATSPCRSLCSAARDGCQGMMAKFAYAWSFNCDDQPTSSCKGLPSDDQEETDEQESVSSSCEPITVPFCSEVGYSHTRFPNSRFDGTQSALANLLSTFTPLVQSQCYEHLQKFLCAAYVPPCTVLRDEIFPCRHVCEGAKDACSPYLRSFGFTWPDELACDTFPTKDEVCLAIGENGEEMNSQQRVSEENASSVSSDIPDALAAAKTHLQAVQEGIKLLQDDVDKILQNRDDDHTGPSALVVKGLKYMLSSLLDTANAVSVFLEYLEG